MGGVDPWVGRSVGFDGFVAKSVGGWMHGWGNP